MRGIFKSWPLTFEQIFKDPVNFILFFFPTLVATALYLIVGMYIYYNASRVTDFVNLYLPIPKNSGDILGMVINFFLVISFYILMNWTYVIVVGILAAPFNDMLSKRVEKKLVTTEKVGDKQQTFKEMIANLGRTFFNEAKKLLIILVLGVFALISYYIPPIYFVGVALSAILFAIQYLDYSWSRHNLPWSQCFKDLIKNIIPYGLSSFIFLILISVPFVVSLVPTFASVYYTILWLHRQNKI